MTQSVYQNKKSMSSGGAVENSQNVIIKQDIKEYSQSVKQNILDIEHILDELNAKKSPPITLYKKVLNRSSKAVLSKWSSGRKYYRTYFLHKAFGKLYPDEYLRTSLCIDGMINILDDILDEPLNEEEKSNYVIEFLRLFSIINNQSLPKKLHESLKSYFNKLITLAVAENFYQEEIFQHQSKDQIVQESVDLLLCRAEDMDIFADIALVKCQADKLKNCIKKLSRIFRALNILKKDIKDIEHDRDSGTDTVVSSILSDDNIMSFDFYIKEVLKSFSQKATDIIQSLPYQSKKSPYFPVVRNFLKMIEQGKDQVLSLSRV